MYIVRLKENIHTPLSKVILEIPMGWELSKAKVCKGKYVAKLGVPDGWGGGGGGAKPNQWGRYGYFLNQPTFCLLYNSTFN